ncbi:tyrosine-type recombinase/integrase [Paenibacillus rhizovicinus]|uniref:Tyrosine-type recombinase/integrase n=1 Tax=Paenibacillus rhizovicinus TaxID=2704463 RepID=A0A6C0P8U5_9BACL|nr:tyrosine-type recombinase/integrase [Paenibacillus rhizovicinus]QHW34805.1 tyrosine-type recombinase/integrase [Paenibacillus rhizovicinus]
MPSQHELEEWYGEQTHAFRIWMKQAGYTETTQKEYMREVYAYLHSLDELAVEKAGKMQVIAFLVSKQQSTGDRTRNRTLSAIRTFYASLIDFEMASRNPALEVKKSKTEKNKKPVYLEEEELADSLAYIEGRYRNRNIAIFLLMSYCGLRVGEVHRLNRSDFKKAKGTIEVFGKGRKWNEIPVPETLSAMLSEVEQERIEPYREKEDAFFVSQKGKRLSIRQIQKIAGQTFMAFKQQNPSLADMKLSCHKLRHTFATMLLKNGVDIRVVKELMGHASIETTMIYTHVNDQQKKQAMSTINIPMHAIG